MSEISVPLFLAPVLVGNVMRDLVKECMQRLRAVFLRPIPVAAGAMIPGTVTAAAAAAVFLMKVLLSI